MTDADPSAPAAHAPEALCIALDEQGMRAFPALESERDGDWVLRATGGINRRVDSATALDPSPPDLDARLARVIGFYRARGLPPLLRFPEIWPGLAVGLMARGWSSFRPCFVMHRELGREGEAPGELQSLPRGEWMALQVDCGGFPAGDVPTLERMFDRLEVPAHWLALRLDGAIAGAALLTEDGGGFGLQKFVVPAARRGLGLGRALLAALLGWAGERGDFLWLQVLQANDPAVGLYRSAGFATAYTYRYWQPPLDAARP